MSNADHAPGTLAVRPGAIALALAGLLLAIFPLLRPFYGDPGSGDAVAAASAAAAIASPSWVVSHLLAAAGLILLPLGALAVLAAIQRERPRLVRRALVATMLTTIGCGMLLVVIGGESFGLAAAAHAFQDGESTDLLAALNRVRNPALSVTLLVGLLVFASGGIAFATTIWRSALLPRWAGVLFAVGVTLWMPLLPQIPRILDGLVLGIGACWLASGLWRLERGTAVASVSTAQTTARAAEGRPLASEHSSG